MIQGRKDITKKHAREAVRYFQNARSLLRNAKVRYHIYEDAKPAREACGTAYLATLEAINAYLVRMGMAADKLPTSVQEYQRALAAHSMMNGKVLAAFTVVYQNLHIFGYYRAGVNVEMIKAGFERARFIIEHLTRQKIA